MSRQLEKEIEMWNGQIYGVKVSEYGLKKGYLDYKTLSEIVGACFVNNTIRDYTMTDWEIVNGEFDEMVFTDYIISKYGYEILKEYTDELVFYNENLDIYVWAITHYGTAWDYVLTDVKLKEMNPDGTQTDC